MTLLRAGVFSPSANINHKGLQRTANEYTEERRIYKDLISKNNNVDILNSASRILQCEVGVILWVLGVLGQG